MQPALITYGGFALAFVPGLFWLIFIHRKDLDSPEPWGLVSRTFSAGCVAALLISWTRPRIGWLIPLDSELQFQLIDAFVATSLCEESLKALALYFVIYRKARFDQPMDGIVYGAATGLGFATVENVFYWADEGGLVIILIRAFTSTLVHAMATAGVGFGLCCYKLSDKTWLNFLVPVAAFSFAVICHGFYDLFLFSHESLKLYALLGVLPVMLLTIRMCINWCHR